MRVFGAMIVASMVTGLTAGPIQAEVSGTQAAQERPEDKIVCQSRPMTGTRFRTKTCHTVAQWDKIAEENRRSFEEMKAPLIETRRN